MKRFFIVLLSGSIWAACGSGETKEEQGAKASQEQTGGLNAADERGLELIAGSDCTTCHKIDQKLIGPAYVDVANKYEATDEIIDTLVARVKNGSSGNWGPIPMTPHPDLPEDDVRTMVKYILSLKNK